MRFIGCMAIRTRSRECPRLFMRSVAIGAIFAPVDINRDLVALLLGMAFLTFPSTFANECPTNSGRIVATHAMHPPHTRNGHPHVVMTLHALPIDGFAKPFYVTEVTALAGCARLQLRFDVMSDLFRNFFPMCILSMLGVMTTTATYGTGARVRLVFFRLRFGGFGRARAARFTVARQAASTGRGDRAHEQPFPVAREQSLHNAPS